MTAFTTIAASTDIALKKPITFEHGRAFYNNPLAIAEGDPTAPKIAIAKIPAGGSTSQTAIATDETDTSKRLAPNGSGGVVWALPGVGGGVSLSASANGLTSTNLNSGIWLIFAIASKGTSPIWASNGWCILINGSIVAQGTVENAADSTAGVFHNFMVATCFSVGGSGASKTVSFTPSNFTGTSFRMGGVRTS